MQQAVELALILLFVAIAQGALDPAGGTVRRIVWSFVLWCLAFAVGIFLLSTADMAAVVTQVVIVVLVAFGVRWGFDGLSDWLRGPFLFPPPQSRDLGIAAQQLTERSADECAQAARVIARDRESNIALLALMTLKSPLPAGNLEQAWRQECDETLGRVKASAERLMGEGHSRPTTNDVRFLAQALCLYQEDSVARALKGQEAGLGGRHARKESARRLEKMGARRKEAEALGLVDAPRGKEDQVSHAERVLLSSAFFWPAIALARAGFIRNATALTIGEAALLGYGLASLMMNRGGGWIFIAVGILCHVQALMCAGDFLWLAARRREEAKVAGKMT